MQNLTISREITVRREHILARHANNILTIFEYEARQCAGSANFAQATPRATHERDPWQTVGVYAKEGRYGTHYSRLDQVPIIPGLLTESMPAI